MPRHGQIFTFVACCGLVLACAGCRNDSASPGTGGVVGVSSTPNTGGQSTPSGDAGEPKADSGAAGAAGSKPAQQAEAGSKSTPQPEADAMAQAGTADGQASANVTLARSKSPADDSPEIEDAEYATFISHINEFGLDLGQKLVEANEYEQSNLIYSPLSVAMALAMTYAGAHGTTASEMKNVLGDSFAQGQFHVASNRLSRELASRQMSVVGSDGAPHDVVLKLVNSLWVERTFALESAFLDVLSREYDSSVRQADFLTASEPARKSMNDWVSDQTKMRIQDLIPKEAVDDSTRVVLVNALYFCSPWATSFTAAVTKEAYWQPLSGAQIQVPTMHNDLVAKYRSSSDYAVAEVAYIGRNLGMTIVLPASGKFEAVRSQVSDAWLAKAVADLSDEVLAISLPKFKVTSGTFSLKTALMRLGMTTPFGGGADFSGITKSSGLVISDVVQKAVIDVNEAGTEAAASSAVLAGLSAIVGQRIPFVVDRPFLFFIRDASGVVLFAGQVTNPAN